MKSRIPTILALYKLDLLSKKDVIEWADKQLMNESEPFEFIIQLSLEGPDEYLKITEPDFPRDRELSYIEEFSLKFVKLNENYDYEVDRFVQWVVDASLGLDINQREVRLGYLVDEYFLECNDLKFAHDYLKTEIVDLLPMCKKIANKIWQEIYEN